MKSEPEEKKKKNYRCSELKGAHRCLRGAMGSSKSRHQDVKGKQEVEAGEQNLTLSLAVKQEPLYAWVVFPTAANSSIILHSCC